MTDFCHAMLIINDMFTSDSFLHVIVDVLVQAMSSILKQY